MDVWAQPLRFQDRLSDLKQSSTGCDFCMVRWNVCKQLEHGSGSQISFNRLGSMISVNGTYPPVLSIFQEPGTWEQVFRGLR